jgi:SPP1 family predicted phage head-tail adaptor
MGIGQRKQIQLVQMNREKGTDGKWISAAEDTFTTWAEVLSPSGGRSYEHGQTVLDNTRRFLIRYRFDKFPFADWKVRYQGKDWTVKNLQQQDEKRFYWAITAECADIQLGAPS